MSWVKWTIEEDDLLQQSYSVLPISTIEQLLPRRTLRSIYSRAKTLKLRRPYKHFRQWTKNELNILKEMWPINSVDEILLALPDRTEIAIKAIAKKLKLKKIKSKGGNQYGNTRIWTKEEDAMLLSVYSKYISIVNLCRELNRTENAVRTRAKKLGVTRSKEVTSKLLSISCQGKNVGRKRPDLAEWVKNNPKFGKANPFYGKTHSQETRALLSKQAKELGRFKKLNKDPSFQQKRIKALIQAPNKAEYYLDSIIQEVCPKKFKYTGDGSYLVDNLNPDWVSTDGTKKIIELFGEIYHDPEKSPRKIAYRSTETGRIEAFAQCGYETLIVWGKELANSNRVNLIEKLRKFV